MNKVEPKYTPIDYHINKELKTSRIEESKLNDVRSDLVWILFTFAIIATVFMLYLQNRHSHTKEYQTQVNSLVVELENSVTEFKNLQTAMMISELKLKTDSSETVTNKAQFESLNQAIRKFELKVDSLKTITRQK